FDKNNFRYNYSLTNCTNCGPRYSIIKTIPYDRKNTSLKDFTLCKKCQNEFEIQTIEDIMHKQYLDEECGPTTFLYDNKQTLIASKIEAINLASKYINDGKNFSYKKYGRISYSL
ncbi:MAG: carbamoyltransferase HypF, partial [Aliarcobacter cryaerophilus]|nr:carbamoyltransferase HypF [Aliarcobacter cryaerophilus]